MTLLEGSSNEILPRTKLLPSAIAASRRGTSPFQFASLLEQIQRSTLQAKRLVLDRSADDLTRKLEIKSWSVSECLDHLARTTHAFLPAISKAVATAPKLTTNRPLRTGTIALLLIRNLELPYRLRYKVLPQLVPQQTDFESAWSAFEDSQLRLSEAIGCATGLAIDRVEVQCPVCAHVTYNAYGAFRMLAAHQRRHLWQMEQILGALDGRRRLKA
jgi:hypothetical protein